jgi:hypothetical protein
MAPEKCLICFRRGKLKNKCAAFNTFQSPCWAYTDDPEEFERREKERRTYEFMCKGINKPELEASKENPRHF